MTVFGHVKDGWLHYGRKKVRLQYSRFGDIPPSYIQLLDDRGMLYVIDFIE